MDGPDFATAFAERGQGLILQGILKVEGFTRGFTGVYNSFARLEFVETTLSLRDFASPRL